MLNYFLLLCFCFKNLDLLDRKTTQFNFALSNLFVIFTSCSLKLWVKSLHLKQYVVPGFFFNFYRFYSWLRVYHVLHYQFFIVIFPKLLVIWLIAKFFNSLFLFFGSFIWVSSFFSFSFSSVISAFFSFCNFSLFDWAM